MADKKPLLIAGIISWIVVLDQVLKMLIHSNPIQTVLIPGLLEVTYVENSGVIYGLFPSNPVFTVLIPLILGVFLALYFFRFERKLVIVCTSLILAGLMGNLLDRLFKGFVIDFLNAPFLNPLIPTFNIADASTFIGVLVLIAFLISGNLKGPQ